MTDPVSARLLGERDAALAQLAALGRDHDAMVAASEASNADDEHDPEGATIGFERAQLAATIDMTKARIADLDRALEQVADGGYGRCERCGGDIGAERLAARPSARTCITCAR
ncbi:MAG: transcriptional regulator, TraR/DksA family [Frankiales bacterium]|nr:transcriptional regulator, TraR/DksA family [Frankiales bacterium]